MTLENAALTYIMAKPVATADITITLPRDALNRIIVKQMTFSEAIQSSRIAVTGDAKKLDELMELMDEFPRMFEIIEPKRAIVP